MTAREVYRHGWAALTPRQERFAREYVANCGVGKAAAIAAGYKAHSAEQQASALLRIPKVSAFIGELRAAVNKRLDITAEEVLRIATNIARTTIDQVLSFGPGGVIPKDSSTLSKDVLAAVAEVGQTVSAEGGSIRIKLADKLGALEKLGKHFELWGDNRSEVTSPFDAFKGMTEEQMIERAEALRAARLRAQAEQEKGA